MEDSIAILTELKCALKFVGLDYEEILEDYRELCEDNLNRGKAAGKT